MGPIVSQLETEEIRQELERILQSRIFSAAQRGQSFLRYVVQRSLRGAAPKEYEIAVEVLGRGPEYDPAVDATVRVEAGRLRSRLREYYATEGQSDPVLIEVPKGGYEAVFKQRNGAAEISRPGLEESRLAQAAETIVDSDSALARPAPAEVERSRQGGAVPAGRPQGVGQTRRIWLSTGLAIGALALLSVLLLVSRSPEQRNGGAGPIRSLAVLPLQNLSGNPNEDYFVDGMTDELITELAHIQDLRVVSRTSAMQNRGNGKSLRQIARELEVDAVVEGSVVRSGGRVRITAQLIDARDDRHLWAESYEEELGDVLTLQDKVVREIAAQMQMALAPSHRRETAMRVDPVAYDAYLRGLYFLHLREPLKSAQYFRQAISIAPMYATAYAGLAEALASEAVIGGDAGPDAQSRARAAAERAIQLDPANGDAYAALGMVEITYKRNWTQAGRDLEEGLRLNPNNPLAEMQYSIYLDAMDRPEDAVSHMRHAVKLDPLSFYMNRHLGSVLYFARHYDESLFYLHRATEMEPGKANFAVGWASLDYEMTGRIDEAERNDLLDLPIDAAEKELAPLRSAYQRRGWKAYHAAKIKFMSRRGINKGCSAYVMGESYLRLGNFDQAFFWLARGIDEHCFWQDSLPVDPLFDGLRSDPRFPALLRRAHL